MNFSPQQHKHSCGIALQARALYVCLHEQSGTIRVHKNLPTPPKAFLRGIAPYRDEVVGAGECLFTWYWLADLGAKEGSAFVLGPALSLQAMQGGKAKNDKIAAHTSAVLLRGDLVPQASVSPAERRAPRDLGRRRWPLVHTRAALLAHRQHTTSQSHLPALGKPRADKAKRAGGEAHFPAPRLRNTIAVEVSRLTHSDQLLGEGELSIPRTATAHAVQTCTRFQAGPGRGQIRALGRRSAIHDLRRFPRGQDCVSSCRLVPCAPESGGKRLGTSGTKSGTVPVRGAFAAAAVLFLRQNQPGKDYFTKLARKHGKGKALTVLAPKLARAVYSLLTRAPAFDLQRFVSASPLRGEPAPAVSLATNGQSLRDAPSFSTARPVMGHLDPRPGARGGEWPVSPAHLLGDASPSVPWLPLHRV